MDVRDALKAQVHAALAVLKETMDKCPDHLWRDGPWPVAFWHVAYHTLYYTHLYLQQDQASFVAWERHRPDHQHLPHPEEERPAPTPYTRAELLEYWRIVDGLVDSLIDRLDLDASESGFPWHKMIPKFEHQLHNLRHIQHHAAILSARLRQSTGEGIRWVRSARAVSSF